MTKKTLELKDLAAGESYAVQVRALGDGEDNVDSPWSLTLNFTTDKDEVAPREPNNLSVVVDGSSFVGTWTQPTENEDGSTIQDLKDYEVTVRDVDNGGTQVYYTNNQRFEFTAEMNHAVFGTNASGVTDVPNFLSKTIEFSVKSRDLAHNTSTTPAVDQATNGAPSAFTLTNNEADSPLTSSLSWDAADGNDLLVYRVRRGISTGTYDTNKITTDTHFTESNLARGDYFYLVEAYDKFGNMTASNEVTVTVVGFWEADFAVPDAPTISNILESFDLDSQTVELTFDVTGPSTADTGSVSPYDYHSHYVVRWSTSATGPFQYQTIDETDNTVTHDVSIQGLQPNTLYYYGVKSVSEYGQSGLWESNSLTTIKDESAPATPTGLSASGSLKNITVSWNANSESDLASYELFASQTSGAIQEDVSNNVTGHDLLLEPGTSAAYPHSVGDSETWYYRVRVLDTTGNKSGLSIEVSATSTAAGGAGDGNPPSDVTGVGVTATTYYHGSSERAYADASWTAATDDTGVSGYIVSFSTDGQLTWTENVAGPNETTYRIPDLEPGVAIAVRIKAVDASGNISTNWSTVATATPTNTDGAIQESVGVVTGGAIESDNYVAGTSGFRLDDNSLEIYGDGTLENVSVILGGGMGLNLNTTTNELWFGNPSFSDAQWRVDGDGNMRVGGAVAGDHDAFYADDTGDIWSGNDLKASAPWLITSAGAARFDNVKITGDSIADGQQVVNVGGEFIITRTTGNTAQVDLAGVMNVTGDVNVNNGSINLTGGDLRVTSGDIESSDGWVYGAGVGFRLINVNDLSKPGVLQAQGAEIDSLVVAGTSDFGGTMSVTGTIQSSTQTATEGWSINNLGEANFGAVSISPTGHIDVNAGAFEVTESGVMSATGATVQGTINANDGYLQNMNITGLLTATGSVGRVEVDTSGVRLYDATTGGNIVVNMDTDTGNASFTGDVTIKTGTITNELSVTDGTNLNHGTRFTFNFDNSGTQPANTTEQGDTAGTWSQSGYYLEHNHSSANYSYLAFDDVNNLNNGGIYTIIVIPNYTTPTDQSLGVFAKGSFSAGSIVDGVTFVARQTDYSVQGNPSVSLEFKIYENGAVAYSDSVSLGEIEGDSFGFREDEMGLMILESEIIASYSGTRYFEHSYDTSSFDSTNYTGVVSQTGSGTNDFYSITTQKLADGQLRINNLGDLWTGEEDFSQALTSLNPVGVLKMSNPTSEEESIHTAGYSKIGNLRISGRGDITGTGISVPSLTITGGNLYLESSGGYGGDSTIEYKAAGVTLASSDAFLSFGGGQIGDLIYGMNSGLDSPANQKYLSIWGNQMRFEENQSLSTGNGLILRTTSNPAGGESIFEVQSSGGAVRLAVDHAGAIHGDALTVGGDVTVGTNSRVTSSSGYVFIDSKSALYLDSATNTDINLRESGNMRLQYDASINAWRFFPDGTERLRFSSNNFSLYNNTRVSLENGNTSSPGLRFNNDTNSGLRLDSNGDWRAVVNGVDALQFSNQIAVVQRDFRPDANNARDCGLSSHGWDVVWRYGEASPSDPSIKQDVTDVDAESSANVLRSFRDTGIKEYRYNNSKRGKSTVKGQKVKKKAHDDKKARRKHRGVMAPDLREKLSGVVEEDMLNNYVMEPEPDLEGSTWGVSYTATIPDLINVITDLLDRVEELEKEKRNANI